MGPKSDLEDRIIRLLLGDDRDVENGIELIHDSYSDSIGCWIQRGFGSLSAEDVADAWQETLLCIVRMVVDRQFQENGSIFALLCSIMRRRSIDVLNANKRYQNALERYRHCVGRSDEVANVDPLFRDEVFHLICEATESLPPKQKTVWDAYRGCGFAVRNLVELVEAVAKATGVRPSEDSIRRARQEGRDKIREHLRRKDYEP